ncbi:MAG: hypothetical protein ACRDOU_13610 [Streptosporangiaceae bacterium]
MTALPTRSLRKAAALALGGIALIATAACGAAASAATQGPQQSMASLPVVVSCVMKTQVRPGSFTLACADGNAYVSGLSWTAWGSSSALASGKYAFNDCTPNCLSGHNHTFSGLVVLWGAKALPKHAGVSYFSEMTIILTGNRSYTAGGKKLTESQTLTIPLSNFGGA